MDSNVKTNWGRIFGGILLLALMYLIRRALNVGKDGNYGEITPSLIRPGAYKGFKVTSGSNELSGAEDLTGAEGMTGTDAEDLTGTDAEDLTGTDAVVEENLEDDNTEVNVDAVVDENGETP